MNTFIQFIVIFISIPVGILRAWVFLSMWRWFILPTFELPDLTLGIAYALTLFVGILTGYKYPLTRSTKDEVLEQQVGTLILNLIMILFAWLVAWVVHLII